MAQAPAKKSPKQPPRWRQLWDAFWDGFSRPSRLAAVMALISFGAMLGASAWFFSPGTLAGPMGHYLPRSGKDAHAFATLNALRLGANWVDRPTVLAFGSSTIAQSLDTGRTFTDLVNTEDGRDWQFITFAAPEQSPLDQMVLLDTALAGHRADSPPVVVLLSASALRMSWTIPRMMRPSFIRRIGVRSDWAADEFARFGADLRRPQSLYAVDNFDFIALRGTEAFARLLLNLPVTQDPAVYGAGPAKTGAARVAQVIPDRFIEGQQNTDVYFGMLRRLIQHVQGAKNVHVVLMDETFAPDAFEALDLNGIVRDGAAQISDFATDLGVEYWTPAADAKLAADDFRDALHVFRGEPQRRVQRELARYFTDYIDRTDL